MGKWMNEKRSENLEWMDWWKMKEWSNGWKVRWTDGLGFMISNILFSDPFVKIQLVHGLKLVKTKKTSFLRGTIDPFYNESFSFKVPQEELENASLVFTGR